MSSCPLQGPEPCQGLSEVLGFVCGQLSTDNRADPADGNTPCLGAELFQAHLAHVVTVLVALSAG